MRATARWIRLKVKIDRRAAWLRQANPALCHWQLFERCRGGLTALLPALWFGELT